MKLLKCQGNHNFFTLWTTYLVSSHIVYAKADSIPSPSTSNPVQSWISIWSCRPWPGYFIRSTSMREQNLDKVVLVKPIKRSITTNWLTYHLPPIDWHSSSAEKEHWELLWNSLLHVIWITLVIKQWLWHAGILFLKIRDPLRDLFRYFRS